MITLGVTGGIGSGKSLVCKILEAYGLPIYDCDERAKLLYNTDKGLKEAIIKLLGLRAYDTDTGVLNKAYLAEQIFSDKTLLDRVNAIVHPLVREDIDKWKLAQEAKGYELVVIESALFVNAPELRQRVDRLLVVAAPLEERIRRVLERERGTTREDVMRRVDKQTKEEDMKAVADYILNNDGSAHILPEVEELYQTLLSLIPR